MEILDTRTYIYKTPQKIYNFKDILHSYHNIPSLLILEWGDDYTY